MKKKSEIKERLAQLDNKKWDLITDIIEINKSFKKICDIEEIRVLMEQHDKLANELKSINHDMDLLRWVLED